MPLPACYYPTAADEAALTLTVAGEGRGEDFRGQCAIVHVAINRLRQSRHRETTLCGIVTEPAQFSCWNPDDPNRRKLEALTFAHRSYREALRAVLTAFEEPDFTNGATHYHALRVRPRWSRGHKPCLVHGGHKFYNTVA